jgi:hypothetical protein
MKNYVQKLHGWTSGLHALHQHFDKGGVREAQTFRWLLREGMGMGALSHSGNSMWPLKFVRHARTSRK